MADASALDTTQQQQQDAMQKEWAALQRRYYAQLVADGTSDDKRPAAATPSAKRARCFVSLSDPDLSARFKGETELLFELPAEYPAREPVFDFRHYKSRLTAQQFEAIDSGMKVRAIELRGTLSLRKLLTWLDNNFYPLLMSTGEEGEAAAGVEDEVSEKAPVEEAETADVSADAIDPTSVSETNSTSAAKKKKQKKKDTSRTVCRFFIRQQCKSGDLCKFSHELRSNKVNKEAAVEAVAADANDSDPAPTPAKKKASTPKSKKAKEVKVVSPVSVENAAKPKPAKQGDKTSDPAPAEKSAKPKRAKKQKACKFFALGKCRDGEKCKFLHETKPATVAPTTASGEPTEEPKKKGIIIKVMKAPPSASEDLEHVVTSLTAAATNANQAIASEDWSETQQKALDKALKKYPATFDKKIRWLSIASEVGGKSLNECIDRFKFLCKVVRDEQPPGSVTEGSHEPVKDDSAIDKRIIAADTRVAIQTEPEEKGAQIRLEELFLHQIGTLIPHRLVCQVQCANCPLKFDANLALDKPSLQKWCPRCSVLHEVHLRPAFAHVASSVLAYVDTNENCSVVDVVPSELLATCLECGGEVLFPGVSPTRRAEHGCFSCHTKLALQTKRYIVGQFTLASSKTKSSSPSAPAVLSPGKKSAQKKLVENFALGQPLPNKGICEHYRHSFRWFRFQCCGKVFPCDVCHDSSDCAQANLGKFASRMICGLCSKEQSSAVKQCACGNEVGKKKIVTSHWEGGAGCRDPSKMALTDKKKFRGLNKTESKKQTRVGANAKKPATTRNNPAE